MSIYDVCLVVGGGLSVGMLAGPLVRVLWCLRLALGGLRALRILEAKAHYQLTPWGLRVVGRQWYLAWRNHYLVFSSPAGVYVSPEHWFRRGRLTLYQVGP